jgi:hypothetical protein
MGTNVAALHFKRSCDSTIMKQCFDAMRVHKEQEKLNKVNSMLNSDELPLIEALQNETDEIEI